MWIEGLKWLLLAVLLTGCASEVVRAPADFVTLPETGRTIEMQRTVTLNMGASRRSLFAAGRWTHTGTLTQGEVYSPVGTVFTIEGANSHEACLVLRGSSLVGYYLPGERAYAPLSEPVMLEFLLVKTR